MNDEERSPDIADGPDTAHQWASMLERGDIAQGHDLGVERMLRQDEIDSLMGVERAAPTQRQLSGLAAIVDPATVSYEKLPMLEVIFDRLVRLLTANLRNFFSDNVEVSLADISSVRFGDYINSVPLPAIVSVFKAEQWDNYGLMSVDPALTFALLDVLLGGRRNPRPALTEMRPYSTLEIALVSRMLDIVLSDSAQAFNPLCDVNFTSDRIESNPRFATIARPANAAILVQLRIEMEARGGLLDILLPYATIEPIRELLLENFMGEKFGRDPIWETHLANEIWNAEVEITAIAYEARLPLERVAHLQIGETLTFDQGADAPIALRCGDFAIGEARMGHVGSKIAVKINQHLRRSRTTLAAYEAGAQKVIA